MLVSAAIAAFFLLRQRSRKQSGAAAEQAYQKQLGKRPDAHVAMCDSKLLASDVSNAAKPSSHAGASAGISHAYLRTRTRGTQTTGRTASRRRRRRRGRTMRDGRRTSGES